MFSPDKALMAGVESGNLPTVKAALNSGADANRFDVFDTPLTAAVKLDEINMIELLIAHGAQVNDCKSGSRPLWHAAVDGKAAIVRVLLAHGASPNTHLWDGKNKTLLQAVNEAGKTEVMEILRRAGAK